ncbi:penicillin-insensitive murein endopeptidase [Myxococcus sp. K38C18041901]|uniref:LysM peptidoglycan-binding domain-containing protein n=1 Tax=Myxococcus guangdongensis TaxID=2906760 RepID=UPI0020A72F82|nr:penicillin-insensitive murein endopeptidase [Myxococcus guangdongensis]MCP3061410.1 penicillin-insensitive murein endopeptidase [Myxococcus guangdongensis]
MAAPSPASIETAAAPVAAEAPAEGCALSEEDLEGEDETAEASEGEGDDGEGETPVVGGEVPTGPLYTADLSDEELARRWKDDTASLGSMAVGFAHSGRLVNSVQFPKGEGADWLVVQPEIAWGTQESIDYLIAAIREVRARFPEAPPIRVNGISNKEGGYKRPHKSHQNGRDVDVGFYYPTVDPIREREREKYINVPLNWAFIRAVVTKTDIQLILVDKRVQKVLYDYALSAGEDKVWLDSLFHPAGIIRHARRHRDHFHLRFHNPKAQELGRRVQPLLSLQPEHNVTTHRIRSGDTLGGIALRYNSTVALIRKANRMKNNFLRAGQRLAVPLRGPCTHCPVPPPFVLPPRTLPPEPKAPLVASVGAVAATEAVSDCAKPVPAPAPGTQVAKSTESAQPAAASVHAAAGVQAGAASVNSAAAVQAGAASVNSAAAVQAGAASVNSAPAVQVVGTPVNSGAGQAVNAAVQAGDESMNSAPAVQVVGTPVNSGVGQAVNAAVQAGAASVSSAAAVQANVTPMNVASEASVEPARAVVAPAGAAAPKPTVMPASAREPSEGASVGITHGR